MMDVRPIRDDGDLTWALAEIARYFDHVPVQGSTEADRFDVLSTLIESYESRVHAVPPADPADVLRFAIETLGHSQAELADLLNSRPRASEVLSGKRPLTLDMIRAISTAWRIPAAALMAASTASQAA